MKDKQVIQNLRYYAYRYRQPPTGREIEGTEALMETAANRIEALSAQLAAAVNDLTDALGQIESIRQRYMVDDDDADEALASLCGQFCSVEGGKCFKEGAAFRCENFCWRGLRKED